MAPLKPFIKQCEAAWRGVLEEVGFTRRGGNVYFLDVNEDVFGSLGLNRVPHLKTSRVEVNPMVSVCHLPLETEVALLRGREAPKRYKVSGAIAIHLGYLTPQNTYSPWWFREADTDVETLSREMASSVVEYAFPFYHEHATLRAIYESMRDRRYGGVTEEHAYRVPIAAWMLGMPDAARTHVAEYMAKLEENARSRPAQRLPIPREKGVVAFLRAKPANDRALREYQEFADRFLKLIESGERS